ncbi:MAG TPA: dTDP-4-dehydrorhamnose 3,5-epimerase [Candidatus Baltobacteraceae bacterium]|nr:dTDP-4-dehydrorhamnose 3,5-epimerase [Candidatus Baltobacteraceae bacterium]
MHFSKSKLDGPIVVEPDVFPDDRGYFKETYSQQKYAGAGITETFVQDNVSISSRGVLRGLHYDLRMAKLVQCLYGEIFDAVVDMREDSATYLQWDAYTLSGENHRQLYVPAGFAHGFYVLSDRAIVSYKQSALYDPQFERAVRWNDPRIGIDWPIAGPPVLSAKDASC